MSAVDRNRQAPKQFERQRRHGNITSERRSGDETGSYIGHGIQGTAGSFGFQLGGETVIYPFNSLRPTVGIGNFVNGDVSDTRRKRGSLRTNDSAKLAAGTRTVSLRHLYERRKHVRECGETLPRTRNAEWYDVNHCSLDRHEGVAGNSLEAASKTIPVHAFILRRASWGHSWVVFAGGDCSPSPSRRSHATSLGLSPRQGWRRQHVGRIRRHDACGWSPTNSDIDHHLIKTRPDRDGRDRVGNSCTYDSRSVDRTYWTNRTGPFSSSVPLIPPSHYVAAGRSPRDWRPNYV